MHRIELLLDCKATIGESPTWWAAGHALYWIDVKAPCLYQLDANGSHRRWPVASDIGAFALLQDGIGALVALRTGVFSLDFASGAATQVAPPPFDPNLFRFNEGICDARGRFWVGVMFDPLPDYRSPHSTRAALHSFTFGSGLIAAADEAELHNGFAWDEQDRFLYLAHSNSRRVYRRPYELATGTLGRAEPFVDLSGGTGLPDGAAVDEQGCYWCAVHGASQLHRYDAAGTLLSQIALPVSQPTMCAFVGADLDEMVITSAREKLTPEQLAREPHAGGIFRFRPGVRGVPRPCVVH